MERATPLMKSFTDRPSPIDFVEFFPWACKQYEYDVAIQTVIDETKATTKNSKMIKEKKSKGIKSIGTKEKICSSSTLNFFEDLQYDKSKIDVTAIFNNSNKLISIKINNNVQVPRTIFQIISLIIEFHPSLTSLSANRGLDAYSIHEISKILPKSTITEVCLDGTCLINQNYNILLETVSNLNCLSLAKCQINDETIQKIAECLAVACPSAKTLTFLNLSSNKITDTGAAQLGDALKTNRRLAYLNLADNHITDTGASHIFNIMLKFPISNEDFKKTKVRRIEYLKKRNKLFDQFVVELKNKEEKKSVKRKGDGKLLERRQKPYKKTEDWAMAEVLDEKFFEKAEKLALQAIGPFEDPFSDSVVKDDIAYCAGNNTLNCLNLAYNNLSFNSLQKLLEVLYYQNQKNDQETPRGLFRVRLEGNYLPLACEECTEINRLLDLAFDTTSSKQQRVPEKKK